MAEPDIDLHLSPSQLQAIGHLSARWGFFETEMDFTISGLGFAAENNPKLPPTFKQRANRWRKLARKFYQADQAALYGAEQLIDAAQSLHEARRVLIHSRIYGSPQEANPTIYLETHRHLASWKLDRNTTAVEEIELTIRELECLTRELIKFNSAYLPAAPRSLPYKPQ